MKNKRNRSFKILLLMPVIFMAIIFFLMVISRPINDNIVYDVVRELKQIPLPENTVIVEEKAIYVSAESGSAHN